MGIFEQFPYTNFHDANLDWILQQIKNMVTEIESTLTRVDEKINNQNSTIENYKKDMFSIVEQYKNQLEDEMSINREEIYNLYIQTLDVYNKTLLQVETMVKYVDNAVNDFGSIAQWSIIDDELTATVFNNGLLIEVGMTIDGRMEVTTNE